MSDIRRVLHSGFALIRSIESNKATASLTLDHLIQEHISDLKKGETRSLLDGRGDALGQKASRWDQLDALENDVSKAIQAIKDAGGDSDKLKNLGIFEADQVSKADDEPSSTVSEVKP